MRFPWANVLLLGLGAFALLTGLYGLMWGSPDRAFALHLHRGTGFAIIALLAWKWQNIFPVIRSAGRWRHFFWRNTASLGLLGLLLLALGTGVWWSHLGSFSVLGFSGITWHILISVGLILPFLWHTLVHRRSLRPRYWAERRMFLRTAGLLAAGFVLWRVGELANGVLGLPGEDRRFTGSYRDRSFSGNDFRRVSWLNDDPDPIDRSRWRLAVRGRVRRPFQVAYAELAQGTDEVTAVLDCTGGWYSEQVWTGVRLARLL